MFALTSNAPLNIPAANMTGAADHALGIREISAKSSDAPRTVTQALARAPSFYEGNRKRQSGQNTC
jgi:hypothetical protein